MTEGNAEHLSTGEFEDALRRLLASPEMYPADAVLRQPSPVPQIGGVYAWYFDEIPPGVPTTACHVIEGLTLLYVGISPKAPPANGSAPSRQTLRSRLRSHFRGNASVSTLRLSLGSLLAEDLGLVLRRVGTGKRMTYGHDGEATLSRWIARHGRVAWTPTRAPWLVEKRLIHLLVLPLNLDQNQNSNFHERLSLLRQRQRECAKRLPIATG